MSYGLRLYHKSLTLGSVFDWFIPPEDSPSAPNKRGTVTFRDDIDTPFGNSFNYEKGKRKEWQLKFEDISSTSKDRLEFINAGWLGSRAITMIFFGTSVVGTNESAGSMSSAGQLWGTGYLRITGDLPEETAFNLWTLDIKLTEYGPNQSFS